MSASRGTAPGRVLVALPVPVDECFTYAVPPLLAGRIAPGVRVRVPFGRRRLVGFVVGLDPDSPVDRPLKPVDAVLEDEAVASPRLRAFCRWVADYYFASWGEVLASAVPAGAAPERRRRALRLRPGAPADGALAGALGRSARRRELIERLRESPAGLPADQLPRDRVRLIEPLERAGLVYWEDEPEPSAAAGGDGEQVTLTLDFPQTAAVGTLGAALSRREFAPFVLHGVTGSGKTEVYLRAAAEAVSAGRGVLYLVPEIGLTPLLARRFLARFGSRVAVLHSGLGRGERWRTWRRVASGEATVVLGARSAIFAPLPDAGLIVVDEEQETSFKQEERPRYHARDLALVRGRADRAVVILGSATPSLESYHHARQGKYGLLQLPSRIGDRPLARVEVVDMREEFRRLGRVEALSEPLLAALRSRLQRNEQSVLLLNRRGYATFVLCRDCGHIAGCPSCSVSLVYHRAERRLRCHYCGHVRGYPRPCESCGGERLHAGGEGTERLEEYLSGRLPEARIVRLDRDVVRRRGGAERILAGFAAGDSDILLGTQMVAKGHDFPRVTLVGVLGAEGTLGLPDFRAAERTFQLLTQVAGRAGRGGEAGEVLLQTYQPDHYAVRHARRQDYEGFYEEEVRFRRLMQYPPFTVLANLVVSRQDAGAAARQGSALAAALARSGEGFVRILGPAPAPITRLRGRHRVQILLKARARGRLAGAIREALRANEADGFPARHVVVDVDPVSLL